MKSEITLPTNKLKAEGKIIIEYTNGETGEVENRFESENHTFPGSFKRMNNFLFGRNNGNSSTFCILLSDQGDDINYDIPLIPGNIIGYGYPGSNTSSTRQGSETITARNLNVYSDGKWHYKRSWSWLPNQIESEIKSFGIAPLKVDASNDDYSRGSMLPKQYPYSLKGDSSVLGSLCVYDNKKSYKFSSGSISDNKEGVNVTASIYDLLKDCTQTAESINLKDLIPIPNDVSNKNACFTSYSFFYSVDMDTHDIIIMFLYKTTEEKAAVQITKLNSNCTQVKSNKVYQCGTYTAISSVYPFSGRDSSTKYGYCSNGKFYTLYTHQNTGKIQFAEINPANWSADGDFMDAFSFSDIYNDQDDYSPLATSTCYTVCNGIYPYFITTYSINYQTNQNAGRNIIITINPNSNKVYSSRYIYSGNSGGQYFGRPYIKNINGDNVFVQLLSYYYDNSGSITHYTTDELNTYYRNVGDYTLYVLPDNAPKREEGQGVTITYEIAWGYEEDN